MSSRLTLVRVSVEGFENIGFTTLKCDQDAQVSFLKETVLKKLKNKKSTSGELTDAQAHLFDANNYVMERRRNIMKPQKNGPAHKELVIIPLHDDSKVLDAFKKEIEANAGFRGLIFVLYLSGKKGVEKKTLADVTEEKGVPSKEEAVAFLKAGSIFQVHENNTSSNRKLFYSPSSNLGPSLFWCGTGDKTEIPANRIPVTVNLALTMGEVGDNFPVNAPKDCIFTLNFPNGQMHLQAADENVVAMWLVGIDHLSATAPAQNDKTEKEFARRMTVMAQQPKGLTMATKPEYKSPPKVKTQFVSSASTTSSVDSKAILAAVDAGFQKQSRAMEILVAEAVTKALAAGLQQSDNNGAVLDAHAEVELLRLSNEEYERRIKEQAERIRKLEDDIRKKDARLGKIERQLMQVQSTPTLRARAPSVEHLETLGL